MAKSLRDVIDKRHDDIACKQNCRENGTVFHHAPYQCRYLLEEYDELLMLKKPSTSEYPTLPQNENEADTEKIIDFALNIDTYEDMQKEVELCCRNEEDMVAHKTKLENMWVVGLYFE